MSTWDIVETDYADRDDAGLSEGSPEHLNNYHLLELLGRGSYGSVRKCSRQYEDGTEEIFAMKILDKKRIARKASYLQEADGELIRCNGLDLIYNEIKIMRQLYHRNIVLLFEVINDPVDYAINMVMEYLPFGPSMTYDSNTKRFHWCNYKKLKENGGNMNFGVPPGDVVQKWTVELLEAVNYIHDRGICHRDIKPENLLINSDGTLRLADFGCAIQIDRVNNTEGLVSETVGTTAFWAPECIHTGDDILPIEHDSLVEDDLNDDLPPLMPSVVQVAENTARGADYDCFLPPVMPSLVQSGPRDDDRTTVPVSGPPGPHRFSAYAMDCWAIGVTMYCFTYGVLPFPVDDSPSVVDAYHLLRTHTPYFSYEMGRGETAFESTDQKNNVKYLTESLLSKNPQSRMSTVEALSFAHDRINPPRRGDSEGEI